MIRFSIVHGDKKIKVMSVYLTKKSDLVVDAKVCTFYRGNISDKQTGDVIKTNKTSVHLSNKSVDGNLITTELFFEKSPKRRSQQFTYAIKSNKFCYIYSRLFPTLSSPPFEISPCNDEDLLFGNIDCSTQTLFVSLFVSDSSIVLPPTAAARCQIFQSSVGEFNVILLVSKIILNSTDHGSFSYPETTKDEVANNDQMREMMPGYDVDQVPYVHLLAMLGHIESLLIRENLMDIDKTNGRGVVNRQTPAILIADEEKSDAPFEDIGYIFYDFLTRENFRMIRHRGEAGGDDEAG